MTDFDTLAHSDQLPILLDLARAAAGRYDLPEEIAVTLVNLSENATYSVAAPDGRRWALRIHRDGYHSRAAIASELAWLVDLHRAGAVSVPCPVQGWNGGLIQDIAHPRMARPRHVVLFTWQAGHELEIGADLSRPFELLGEVAARLHIHARRWRRPPWFTRLTWDFDTSLGDTAPNWGRWRDGIGVDAGKAKLFGRTAGLIGRRLAAYGKGAGRFGLIHGDLRLANLLGDGDAVKVIDFDDCGFGWYMYDAATPVSFYEHEPQVPELIERWKAGYRWVLPLPKSDAAEIPTLVMLRRLLLVAWIGSRRETELAASLGVPYTDGTAGLCEDYLRRFG